MCSFMNCGRRPHARDLCATHYQQLRKLGKLSPIRTRASLTVTDFSDMYEKHDSGCWIWTGSIYSGYGHLRVNGRVIRAHRVAYANSNGPLGDDEIVDHKCRVTGCVNPEHLQIASRKENAENVGLSKANTSGARGVYWDARNRKWCAVVKHNYDPYWAGRHATLAEAESAVASKRNELHTNNLSDRKALEEQGALIVELSAT